MATDILGNTGSGSVVKLTDSERAYLHRLLSSGDRAGFYLGYYNIAGSQQAVVQTKASTFSQGLGGTAYAANRILQRFFAPTQYAGIYHISQLVAREGLNAINADLAVGGDGHIDDDVFFAPRADRC
jgi:hypothetical protein